VSLSKIITLLTGSAVLTHEQVGKLPGGLTSIWGHVPVYVCCVQHVFYA